MPYNPAVPNPHAADAPECRCGAGITADAYYGSGLCAECADAEADVQSLLAYVEARRDLHPADALLDACDAACRGTDFGRWLPLYTAAHARLADVPRGELPTVGCDRALRLIDDADRIEAKAAADLSAALSECSESLQAILDSQTAA